LSVIEFKARNKQDADLNWLRLNSAEDHTKKSMHNYMQNVVKYIKEYGDIENLLKIPLAASIIEMSMITGNAA